MPQLTQQEEKVIHLGRRVKAEGQVTLPCGTYGKAVNARYQLRTQRKALIKRALDFPEECPPDTLEVLSNLSFHLPRGATDLILTDGSWLDRAIDDLLNNGEEGEAA